MIDPNILVACGPEPSYYDDRGIVTLQHINWAGCVSHYKIDHLNDPKTQAPLENWVPTPQTVQPNIQEVSSSITVWPIFVMIFFVVIIVAALVILLLNQNKINRSDQEELNDGVRVRLDRN